MIASPASAEVDLFRALVAERLGLAFDDSKLCLLAEVLRQRIEQTKSASYAEYAKRLSFPLRDKTELAALAGRLTVGETYFFRYTEHSDVFCEVVVPTRMKERSTDRTLRFLCSGCASGEEPYSLAILLRERFPELASWKVEIRGLDVNPSAIEKARSGSYSAWSLRETPEKIQGKYFQPRGRDYQLIDSILAAVQFEECNLAEDDPRFWADERYDAVFCRNVTMYFSADVQRAVVRRIARSLRHGGYLFLGHAETLRGVSQDFHLHHTHRTFYYQRRELHESRRHGDSTANLPHFLSVPQLRSDDTWFDAIQHATERVANLAQSACVRSQTAATTAVMERPAAQDRALALEFLRGERFSEGAEFLRGLPAEAQRDADTQLLLAVLLTNGGDRCEAAKVCSHVLRLDELNAGAHYLLALCLERDGALDESAQHDETAAYLDATFAMPHLHRGLLAKKAADAETARREINRALQLLANEDASRILLFGGGFTREALISFCRAELRAWSDPS